MENVVEKLCIWNNDVLEVINVGKKTITVEYMGEKKRLYKDRVVHPLKFTQLTKENAKKARKVINKHNPKIGLLAFSHNDGGINETVGGSVLGGYQYYGVVEFWK